MIVLFVGIAVTQGNVINKKIVMYQSQNSQIQEEVSQIVENYKGYESNTLENIKTVSPVTLVTLFPDLKSSDLVNKEINLYESNNNQITQLKSENIDGSVYRWWLYFGQ